MTPSFVLPSGVGTVTVDRNLWWRIYSSDFNPNEFNRSKNGNARFSPIFDATGEVIPTLYIASTPAIALMETVLHDIPLPSSGYILTMPSIENDSRRVACLVNTEPLTVADFSALGLRRIGLKKADIIDSEKPHYPLSRSLAEQIYQTMPTVQGIQWTSRQDDSGTVLVLFESRVNNSTLSIWHRDQSIQDGIMFEELLGLLERLDVGLVIG